MNRIFKVSSAYICHTAWRVAGLKILLRSNAAMNSISVLDCTFLYFINYPTRPIFFCSPTAVRRVRLSFPSQSSFFASIPFFIPVSQFSLQLNCWIMEFYPSEDSICRKCSYIWYYISESREIDKIFNTCLAEEISPDSTCLNTTVRKDQSWR